MKNKKQRILSILSSSGKKMIHLHFLYLSIFQVFLFICLTSEKSDGPSLVISRRGDQVAMTKDTSIQIKLSALNIRYGETYINFNCNKHGKGYFFLECLDETSGFRYNGSLRINDEKTHAYSFSLKDIPNKNLAFRIRFIGDNNRYTETDIIKLENNGSLVKGNYLDFSNDHL